MKLHQATMTAEQMTADTVPPQASVESVTAMGNELLGQERWGEACNAYELASYIAKDRGDHQSFSILSSMATVCRRVAFARMGRGGK